MVISNCAFAQTTPVNMDPVASIDVTQPRAFGYYLGDKFQRVVELSLNKPYVLDETRLPKVGKMIPWLRLETPEVDFEETADTNIYRIRLTYQIINIDRDFLDIGVEGHEIGIKNSAATETLNLLIRPVRIRASMIADEKTGPTKNALQADATPAIIEKVNHRARLFMGLAILSYIAFLLLTLGLPFMKQKPAFTNTYHEWRGKGEGDWSAQQYDEALKQTHQAFNKTAGRVVFLEDLDQFLSEHPSFVAQREQIIKFYEHSRDYYFVEKHGDQNKYSPAKIIDLLKNCSQSERSMA